MKLTVDHASISSPKYIALLSLVVVCLLDSLAPICVKWCEQEISASATVFYRFLFGFLIFSLVNAASADKHSEDSQADQSELTGSVFTRIVMFFLFAGAFSACNQFFWAVSLTQTSIGNSALLHSLAPIFTVFFSWVFLGKKFNSKLLVGMITAIAGSILLTVGDFQVSITKLQGDGFALLSAFFSAGYMSIAEDLRIHFSSSMILFWRCLLGAILVAPLLLLNSNHIIPISPSGWLAVFGLTLIFAISHWLLVSSLAIFSSTVVAIVLLLDPFLSSLQAWIFFSEELHVSEWVSFIVVILGVYLALTSDREILKE